MPGESLVGLGRHIATASPSDALQLEASAGKDVRFQARDDVLGWLLRAAFASRPIVDVERLDRRQSVRLQLPNAEKAQLTEWFNVDGLERHGAWYVPKEVSLKVGVVNLPARFAKHPRFATGVALDERARVDTATSPEGLYLWAVLQPLFELLMQPILLRGPELGLKTREEQMSAWGTFDDACRALELHLEPEIALMRFGSGWSRHSAADQLALKQAFLTALGAQVDREVGRRWRLHSIQSLIIKYYAKAGKAPPTQRQVLTASLQRVMVGCFEGDWLAFLDYIGEQPAPSERITTALPEPHLYVGFQDRTPAAAATTGVPEAEVQRILASFLGQTDPVSPVERRVAIMRRYWQLFDELHANQRPSMHSLWGLVEDGISGIPTTAPAPHTAWQYLRRLPADLLGEIDDCWGGVCVPQYEDRIVSALRPHKGFADAFGAALTFWHGVGLTAWFICQGPMSRTDLAGLAHYYRGETEALAAAGCPVDESLFAELNAAESRLGPIESITEELSRNTIVGTPLVVTMSTSRGTKRAGFGILQEIITRHRRAWAASSLDPYLHNGWEHPLRAFSEEYNRDIARTGRPPNRRRTATLSSSVANLWLGGNLSATSSAIGVKAFADQARVKLMPDDRLGFMVRVFAELGGEPGQPDDAWKRREVYLRNWEYRRLADDSLRYIQHEECTDAPPTAAAFHAERYHWTDGQDAGWPAYVHAIEVARMAQSLVGSEPIPHETPVARAVDATDPSERSSRRSLLSRFGIGRRG